MRQAVSAGRRAHVLVNNRAEGNAKLAEPRALDGGGTCGMLLEVKAGVAILAGKLVIADHFG